jgi:integrase
MSVYRRGRVFWYDFVFGGVRYQGSTKTENRKVAAQIVAARKTALAKGEVGIKERPPIPVFSKFAEDFRNEVRSRHQHKPKTVSYYENGLNRLLLYKPLGTAKLDQVDRQMIDDYTRWRRAQRKRNGKVILVATVNREREVLRRMLRLAVEWNLISSAPVIRRLEGEVNRDRVVTHEEEAAYLAAARQPLRDIATIIVDAGLRPEEAFRMDWRNVHLEPTGAGHYGYVSIPNGKTAYARRNVPLTARVKALLEMRHEIQGKPKDGWVFAAPTRSGRVESLKSQHRSALKDSNVRPFVLYSLRHTMLTRLGEAGAEAFSIQKVAGHSSALISQRYVHPTPAAIESAMDKLEAYNLSKTSTLVAVRVQ